MSLLSRSELGQEIFRLSYLQGEFRLRSGQVSSEYFDKYRFSSQPHILRSIAQAWYPLVQGKVDAFAGLELGGVPLATALALEMNKPVVFVRKEAKDYGTCRQIEGLPSIRGLSLVVVEDVITTGGQVLESIEALQKEGARVEQVLCVILRGTPDKIENKRIIVTALFTMEELKSSVS